MSEHAFAVEPAAESWSLVVSGNVRALMARRGVSQMRLAAVLNLSQTAVSKRLRGVTPWDVNEMGTLAEAFGVPITDLLLGLPRKDSNLQPAGFWPLGYWAEASNRAA